MKFLYKWKEQVTTEIEADYRTKKVSIINHSDDCMKTAFGVNQNPTFEDFEGFLEDRCFPRSRDKMKLHLQELGIDYYDPLSIIKKTHGKLEGDFNSLELVEE